METGQNKAKIEVLSIQEYLEKRKEKRKKEQGEGKLLTKFERNVMIHCAKGEKNK